MYEEMFSSMIPAQRIFIDFIRSNSKILFSSTIIMHDKNEFYVQKRVNYLTAASETIQRVCKMTMKMNFTFKIESII